MPQIQWEWLLKQKGVDYGKAVGEIARYREWIQERRRASAGVLEDEETVVAAKLGNPWLVGCDPEFVIMDAQGQVINTSAVLPKDGPVGYDHSGTVVELRPEPAKGTYMILKRMHKMMWENPGLIRLKNYKWRAGAYIPRVTCVGANGNPNQVRTLTLGGHVHFDMAPAAGDPNFVAMLEALDRLTNHLEQLEILPKQECEARRAFPEARRLNYGQWKDWRPAGAAGREDRMEYRVMASWLFHPHVAYLALTGAKLCAVAPITANEYLKPRACHYSNLRNFFEAFKQRDTNARRACEKLFDGYDDYKHLQHPADVDFKQYWEKGVGL